MRGIASAVVVAVGLLGLTGPVAAQDKAVSAPAPAPSVWRLEDETSKLDGTRRITVGMVSLGKAGAQGVFMLRCINGQIDGLVAWPAYMGSAATHRVRWKTDAGDLRTEEWTAAPGGRRSSLWVRNVKGFVAALSGKSELVVGAEPYGEGERVLVFPIAGFDDIASPLRAACNL